MAAPRALLVLDIVEEIVDRAAVVGSRRESKQLLARLARVSSIFRDPALRRLWAELQEHPLFRLLTNCHRNSGALQPDSVEDDDPEANSVERMLGHPSREERHARFRLTLHGNILTQDISRFQQYAALIRVLRISRRVNVSSLEPPSWDALIQQAGDTLLPSLRELTLPVMPPYPVESRFHVSPSLRELTITFPNWYIVSLTDNIQNLFDSLFARAPQLTRLRIESETYMHRRMEDELFNPWCYNGKWEWLERRTGEQAQGAFSAALSSVDQLEHLELFHMIAMNTAVADASLLRALSLLPNLHDVAFGIHVCEEAIRSVQPGFQHLTSLSLSNVHRGDELQVFNSPLLHSLSIYHTECPDVDECLRTLIFIGQRFTLIRRLVWKAPFRPEHFGNNMDIFVSLVRPLFLLHALETLDLDIGAVAVHDRDITTLAAGLPHLLHFKLKVYKSEHDRRPGLTAGALLALAQGCPGLVSLYMEGVYVPESDYPAIERYFFGHGLRSLYIAGLGFKAESICSMIVDMIFPYLDIAECRKRVKEMHWPCESWVAILDKLEVFHADR